MNPRRVGFVLCSSSAQPIPSTRIAVLNMLPFLRSAGWRPCILFEPPRPSETPDLAGVAARAAEAGCDVVVLQKVHGPDAVALARQLLEAGIRTIYAVCDLVDVPMVEATDATIIVSEYLKSLHPASLRSRIHVVHDGIERPSLFKEDWSAPSADTMQAVLVTSADLDRLPVLGHPPAWLRVRIVGRYARGLRRWRETRWQWTAQPPGGHQDYLRFLLDRRIERVPWDPRGVYDEMLKADIGILPIETSVVQANAVGPPAWQVKSENRLTMKMSMGLPVVATPIPSYESVIEHGVNGFFARSAQDWRACLAALRDPARRREMGMAARASVATRYSMQAQAAKLISVLQGVCPP
jgi:hypothetical protein